jgi:hypothetical protein
MTFSPPSMVGAPRVLPGRAKDLRKIALFPSLSRCLRFGESWPLAPYSGAPASYACRRSWRAPRETIPAHEMRSIGLAISPASSRSSRISKLWAVGRFSRTPTSFRSPAMAAPPRPPPTPATRVPLFPLHLILAAHRTIKGQKWPIPLRGSFS